VDRIDVRFASGNAIGLEAFLNLDGVSLAGFEQNSIIHDDGVAPITSAPEF